ncbi:MAG: hypothetical protein JOZ31_22055 [Verrucomicrobia bacterium]|nr:hypothetical protein [Verrucomicrobiota bacterium]
MAPCTIRKEFEEFKFEEFEEFEEFRSSGVQEFRSSGVQEFRSSGVQEFSVGTITNCKKQRYLRFECEIYAVLSLIAPELLQLLELLNSFREWTL